MDHLTSNGSRTAEKVTPALECAAPYPNSYGRWAGDPKGAKPDFTRCCVGVWTRDGWPREYQCSKKRGFGPDGAYCKQHDPEAVEKRRKAIDARESAKWNERRKEIHGPTFLKALEEIAAGHNDARGFDLRRSDPGALVRRRARTSGQEYGAGK